MEQTKADWPSCHRIAALAIRSIRDIDTIPKLDVTQTAEDRDYHANLTGLPERGSDAPDADITKAERLATLLAKASKAVYVKGKGFSEEG